MKTYIYIYIYVLFLAFLSRRSRRGSAAIAQALEDPLPRLLQRSPGAAALLRQPGHLDLALLDAGTGLLDLGGEGGAAAAHLLAGRLDLVVELHVGEDVVEEHVAHQAALGDAHRGQVLDLVRVPLGLHHQHLHLLDLALGVVQRVALQEVAHRPAAEHVHPAVVEGVLDVRQRRLEPHGRLVQEVRRLLLRLQLHARGRALLVHELEVPLRGVLLGEVGRRALEEAVVEAVQISLGLRVACDFSLEAALHAEGFLSHRLDAVLLLLGLMRLLENLKGRKT